MTALNFPANPSNGDTYENYVYDSSLSVWRVGVQAVTLPLNGLSDTEITSPSDGQALVYDSSSGEWVNETPASTLSDLTDTNISSPAEGQALVYNGSQWTNGESAGGFEQHFLLMGA